jgi:NAD(P)H-hydrate epimerase
MKILSASQIRSIDDLTIKNEGISSLELMENASLAFLNAIDSEINDFDSIIVICGPGNNGGDGLVIARGLSQRGCAIEVWDCSSGKRSSDKEANFNRIPKYQNIVIKCIEDSSFPEIPNDRLIIDALFGSGVKGAVVGFYAQLIAHINSSLALVISVDMPSGLSDSKAPVGEIIRANRTVCFEIPKFNFFMSDCAEFLGDWELVNIGLSQKALSETKSVHFYLDSEEIKKLKIASRPIYSHKGDFGHIKLVVGSEGMMGAALLACRASLRSGAGLVTCHVPKSGKDIIHLGCPEAIVEVDDHDYFFSNVKDHEKYAAIGIGCGLQKKSTTVEGLRLLLKKIKVPLVLDADALNIIAHNNWIGLIPSNSIITPHPGEFDRLVGKSTTSRERIAKQICTSVENKLVIILKGHHTSISFPNGEVYFNSTGNPGMATAGSGDVLLGIITSLLGQYKDIFKASLLGVYWHGLAGDIAAKELSQVSVLASDIIEYLGRAYIEIQKK